MNLYKMNLSGNSKAKSARLLFSRFYGSSRFRRRFLKSHRMTLIEIAATALLLALMQGFSLWGLAVFCITACATCLITGSFISARHV